MPARKPQTKPIVPDALRCTMDNQRGQRCPRQATLTATRIDGTKFKLCTLCGTKLREQIEQHHEQFAELHFSVIDPKAQLEK